MESENCSNEQLTQQSNNRGNGSESLGWHIISILSWILLLFTAWNSYNQNTAFWDSFHSKYYSYICLSSFLMNMPLLKIFVLIISLCGFVVYIIFTTYKKNLNLYNDMLSSWSKFHFIPLLFISALFILGSNIGSYDDDIDGYKYIKMLLIFDIIFTIIALISLIIIYIKTTLNCDWYIVMAIKKGTYSTFIVLLWYNFFYTIICLRAVDCAIIYLYQNKNYLDYIDNLNSLYKVTGILFSILFALGVFIFSLLFKDLMALFVNFLIFIGMVISFFNASASVKELRKENLNGEAEGIIDIVFMGISLGLIAFIAIRFSHKLF